MINAAERSARDMAFIPNYQDRIAAAVQVDRLFSTYEIEMSPTEALSFVAVAPAAGKASPENLYTLIELINDAIPVANFGPAHPRTGLPHHFYRVGRVGRMRIIQLELGMGLLPKNFSMRELRETLDTLAGNCGGHVSESSDEHIYCFKFIWG